MPSSELKVICRLSKKIAMVWHYPNVQSTELLAIPSGNTILIALTSEVLQINKPILALPLETELS